VKQRLQRGDIYEMNLCQEFYGEGIEMDPIDVFRRVNAFAETPFSAFYRNEDHYLICASPERYLSVQQSEVISQPIKGTAKRHANEISDIAEKEKLQNDPKERSENVMIVDLVRNDLSRNARRASVRVPELFGVYTFKSVHQLISTVRAELPEGKTVFDVIRASFPMGSMTGAPKISAMKVIDEVEDFQRGLYSGSVGYIDPDGNADFNVVIRSLLYNRSTGYLSLPVGGAITIQANAEQEYEECLLKASAIRRLLSGDSYL
jgi:para-aminobenzoate synthetase component 1